MAGFLIGSAVADGKINEKEYLIIYPALVSVFGDGFDFNSVKNTFYRDKQGRKTVMDYTENMIGILDFFDERLRRDIIMLCLCVVAVDGRISLKEKNYIRRLCESVR